MDRVTEIAQKSRVNKTLAFWMDEQKGEHPGKIGKYQRDQGEKGGWENKPMKFFANLGSHPKLCLLKFDHKQHTKEFEN